MLLIYLFYYINCCCCFSDRFIFQGECAYIEWTPFDSYDVNNHMSFDEWGVIAHDSTKEPSVGMPPLRIPISTVSMKLNMLLDCLMIKERLKD